MRYFNTLVAFAEGWYPALLQSIRHRRASPTARTTSLVLNPTTIVFGVTSPVILPGGSPGTDGSQNAINVPVSQRSASSSEIERVGKSANGLVVGKGEWGEGESGIRAREEDEGKVEEAGVV